MKEQLIEIGVALIAIGAALVLGNEVVHFF